MAPASSASSTSARICAICAGVAGLPRSSIVATRSVVWPTSIAQLVAAGFARNASR